MNSDRDESVARSGLLTSVPIVDGVLDRYGSTLGRDFIAYRNHAYGVMNVCLAIADGSHDD